MLQILFQHDNMNYVKPCKSVNQKDEFVKKLVDKGVAYTVVGEIKPQLCGCVFTADGTVYTYVRVEGDAEPGMLGEVEVVSSFGEIQTKRVVILDAVETTVEECRTLAAKLGRTKLARIKRVWKRAA